MIGGTTVSIVWSTIYLSSSKLSIAHCSYLLKLIKIFWFGEKIYYNWLNILSIWQNVTISTPSPHLLGNKFFLTRRALLWGIVPHPGHLFCIDNLTERNLCLGPEFWDNLGFMPIIHINSQKIWENIENLYNKNNEDWYAAYSN